MHNSPIAAVSPDPFPRQTLNAEDAFSDSDDERDSPLHHTFEATAHPAGTRLTPEEVLQRATFREHNHGATQTTFLKRVAIAPLLAGIVGYGIGYKKGLIGCSILKRLGFESFGDISKNVARQQAWGNASLAILLTLINSLRESPADQAQPLQQYAHNSQTGRMRREFNSLLLVVANVACHWAGCEILRRVAPETPTYPLEGAVAVQSAQAALLFGSALLKLTICGMVYQSVRANLATENQRTP